MTDASRLTVAPPEDPFEDDPLLDPTLDPVEDDPDIWDPFGEEEEPHVRSRALRRVAGLGACGVAAFTALALSVPSATAATLEVTSLPKAVSMSRADVVSVRIVDAPVCAVGALQAFVAGRQDAVTINDSGGISTARCSGTTLLATVTPTASVKRNAVVKFRLIKSDNSRIVMTLVVHIRR